MPKQETDELEGRTAQRENSRRATFDLLLNKKRAESEVVINIPDGDDTVEVTLLFRAIGNIEYDKLLSKNPPTTEQRAEGSSYNINTFGPALLAAVCVDPDMSYKEWLKIWESEDWNRGEVLQLFFIAVELCNRTLDIPK